MSAILEVGVMGAEVACQPVCNSTCTPGDHVPNPRNCHQYYTCLEGCKPSDVPFNCSEGEKFDALERKCKTDDGEVKCGLCRPPCKYDCILPEGFAAIREDCSTYLFCGMGRPVEIPCDDAKKPYFNGKVCVEDKEDCCDKCEVHCQLANIETADPTSCKHFYFCSEIGFPLQEDRFECPDGENFDVVSSRCMPGAACNEPCKA